MAKNDDRVERVLVHIRNCQECLNLKPCTTLGKVAKGDA